MRSEAHTSTRARSQLYGALALAFRKPKAVGQESERASILFTRPWQNTIIFGNLDLE